ncbi:MAG: hypothetical protein GY894_03675 [Planctomycetes bacterium]|nr:hypothetical protein [Planctomycetota bacterium]MCP4838449.1 hypothetical protein [Planctomycetota bacterium]
MQQPQPTILCPLNMEASRVRRLALRRGWPLVTTGIGADAISRAVAAVDPGRLLVLAGVAGALVPEMGSGTAHYVSEVFTQSGIRKSPVLSEGIRVTGADVVVATPSDKAALAARTGAHIVDMESHAFAEAADAAGHQWAIVRGVSDGVEHHLPAGCDRWFSPSGHLRPLVTTLDLARRPGDILPLMAFGRRTRMAMQEVVKLLDAAFSLDSSPPYEPNYR